LIDLDGDEEMEVLLFVVRPRGASRAHAFKAGPDESWTLLGSISRLYCSGVLDALEAGQLRAVEPKLKDIDANGIRLRVIADHTCLPAGRP
jgi:hypothetical protein